MKKIPVVIILSLLLFVVLSNSVFAVSWWPLVPCGTSANPTECTRCDLFRLFKNIIDFVLIGLMPPVAAILFVWGGFLILMGGANPGNITQGRTIFWNTFMGVLILSSSWLITNTIMKSLATDDISATWYQLECRETVAGPPVLVPPVVPPPSDLCSQPAQLAASNNEPYPRKNAPELSALILCIKGEMPGVNLGSEFTYDNSYELCNYTRGQRTCSSRCSHAVNSCHYGGGTGTEGALAVDFGNQAVGERIIAAALKCGAKSARCETASGRTVFCTTFNANHIHVNSRSCDKN